MRRLPARRSSFPSGERVKYEGGEVLDLTKDIQPNYDFFEKGPGYDSKP
jgi:hypothetical protein